MNMNNMIHSRAFFVPWLIIVVLMLGTSSVHGQPAVAPGQRLINQEPEIKAKLVALQRKFWTWPVAAAPAAGAPFKIGILGDDPFQQGQINHLDERLKGEQDVAVVRMANLDAYQRCHILVVSQAADLAAALKKTQGDHVLVIAQEPEAAKQGALMNLPVVGNRVKMEINLTAASKAGVTPSGPLIRAAEIIR